MNTQQRERWDRFWDDMEGWAGMLGMAAAALVFVATIISWIFNLHP